MYYPQTYHHIQEIQKYNIQDYRPRYDTHLINVPQTLLTVITCVEWNNFRKLYEKFVKCNVPANSVATPSHKPMSPKPAFYRLMIRRENEDGMERWLVRALLKA